jgi:hypothetical protein
MAEIIMRTYATSQHAELTVARLMREGFADDAITLSAPQGAQRGWVVSVRSVFGMGRTATDILDRFNPIAGETHAGAGATRDPGLEAIHELSKDVSPGAISRLSGPVSPGAISSLSRWKDPGAIKRLSGYKSPGAISRLSRYTNPGAVARLSEARPSRSSISRLSSGWYFSSLFGLPLLTRSQGPIEPGDTLLTNSRD